MIKKDEWIFIMRHESKGEKISRVRANTFESALKQIRNRFPESDGWKYYSHKTPDGVVFEREDV